MITPITVPKYFDCFGLVFLLYSLTLTLDNTVATPAKLPILWRYSSTETPILHGKRTMLQ